MRRVEWLGPVMTEGFETVEVAVDHLTELVDQSLKAIGVPDADVEHIRDVLMYAQLRGNNQGLVKIPVRAVLSDPDATPIEITRTLPAVAHIAINGNSGMVAARSAAIEAANLASTYGVGVVGTSGRATSTGAMGYYADLIAREGMVGIVMAGSVKVMAIAGGVDPDLGTNPIAIGVPTGDVPVVFDMTTAAMAWFGLIQAQQRDEHIPAGIAYDATGAATNDPGEAMRGATMTFGGHKGSGLALMIEVMTGPLLGNNIAGDERAQSSGDLFIALNPAALGGAETFLERVDALTARVKAGRKAEGFDEILLPGERGNRQTAASHETNRLRIDKALYEQLIELAAGEE